MKFIRVIRTLTDQPAGILRSATTATWTIYTMGICTICIRDTSMSMQLRSAQPIPKIAQTAMNAADMIARISTVRAADMKPCRTEIISTTWWADIFTTRTTAIAIITAT